MDASTVSSGKAGTARAAHLGPERRRPLVLDAALDVLLKQGYAGTTMSAIAATAGVTKPVVYECFANKDDLLRSLLKREETRLLDSVEAALPSELDFSDLPSLLTASYTAFFSAAAESPDSWRLVFNSQRGLPGIIEARMLRARETIVGQIQQTVFAFLSTRKSDQPQRESAVIAEILVGVAESGARILLAEGGDEWEPADLAAFLTKSLLESWL